MKARPLFHMPHEPRFINTTMPLHLRIHTDPRTQPKTSRPSHLTCFTTLPSHNTSSFQISGNMAPKSLSELAPELLIHIFSSFKTFRDITALTSSSKQLQEIWRSFTVSISSAVPNPTPSSASKMAQELLKVQGRLPALEKSESHRHAAREPQVHELFSKLTIRQKTKSRIYNERHRQATLILNKLFIANAKMVHQARDNKECFHSDGEGVDGYFIWDQPQRITKAQREEFTHEYYRIWT